MTRKSELQMAKKDNFNNNDPISKAVDLLLENTEDLTTVFKPGGLYKELTKRLVEKMLNSEMQNYLGYEKNQHSTTENARNGTSSKKLRLFSLYVLFLNLIT
ncbi:hypothetical protein SHM_19710 [Spiroplasma ixodetis]|uniref:Transposase n=1 Tax=Spiroplasma ixodetis TaxID=2141 RepID=A0ABM8BVT3_9MOLU|nr:transposase [Spiroplasma ixodetis]BDT03862.1 hypothetical protein SHM_15080 [Spiroplasma ixodetis]BDT04325.1 hypothetical protein SHM_19710 [Spiroplasma ixodetis]